MFFDIEPYQIFSGSLSDIVMSGSLVTKTSIGIVTGSRKQIGSNTSSSLGSILVNAVNDYGTFVNYYSGSFRFEKRSSIRFSEICEYQKRYYDTILPNINECLSSSGNGLVLVNPPGSSYNKPYFIYLFGTKNNLGGFYNITSSVGSLDIADTTWFSSFPFSNSYKNAKRNLDLKTKVIGLEYFASVSLNKNSNGPKGWLNTGTGKIINEYTGYPETSETEFWGAGSVGYSFPDFTIGYVVSSSCDKRITSKTNAVALLLTITGSVTTGVITDYLFSPNIESDWGQPSGLTNIPIPANKNDLIKHLFGSKVKIPTTITSSLAGDPTFSTRAIYGSLIQGWKYGILNGFELYPKCLISRNHHGFIRDIFEQRLNTKIYNLDNGTTFLPLTVTFLSGTDAFITSSMNLDTRDSGIYNYEYSSGQPFSDI